MLLQKFLTYLLGNKKDVHQKDIPVLVPETLHEIKEDANGVYIINNAENLYWLARMVNEQGYDFSGKIIQLAADIDLKYKEWIPIGKSMESPFRGIFDGAGHCIARIRVSGEHQFAGLFGVISGSNKNLPAGVSNIRLSEIHIKTITPESNAGGIAGVAINAAKLERCVIGGSIESPYCAGGIVGQGEGVVTLRRCNIRGRVSAEMISGGVSGSLTSNSRIINCTNYAINTYGKKIKATGISDETSSVE